MDRRTLLTRFAALGSVATPMLGIAAPSPRGTRRLAVLLFDGPEPWQWFPAELLAELDALGWHAGKNLSVQWNYANGDAGRLRSLAAQVAASAPDVILTRGTPATQALRSVTKSIPIATGVGDPIGSGFARSYAQPGGNITGIAWATVEASEKQVELLRLLVPGLAEIVVVWKTDRAASLPALMRPMMASGRTFGVAVRSALVETMDELTQAFQAARARGPAAAQVFGLAGDAFTYESIAACAIAARMPTMFENRAFVDGGGLASFRFNWENQTGRTAAQLDKLLRGEKPANIPFELPTRQEFVLNLKTARALGLVVPQAVLLRADAIVE
ncbi:MAG TPA: ABC transporter substrate-binding protein [Caldimonas sp.]|nr:ABC transporter substrate-binding protein [Caldimonas sp.]